MEKCQAEPALLPAIAGYRGIGDTDDCPLAANPDQLDGDGDGIGDTCDEPPPPQDFRNFAVPVGDPNGFEIHGTIWAPAGGPSPLVVLVHGLGCVRQVWTMLFTSLGSYMVTIASCRDLGFLGDNYDRLGVVIGGATPDNLWEVKEWLDRQSGVNSAIYLFMYLQ